MDRRTLIKLSAAAALAHTRSTRAKPSIKIVVAGAGIVGASIAYHLAKAGASVTIIDKQGPATHASRGTFAWVNATWAKQPRHYHEFNQQGLANWHSLQKELDIPVRWGGSLEWFTDAHQQETLVKQIAEQVEWGEPASMLSVDDVAQLEPNLTINTDSLLAYSPNDGALDPVIATQKLLKAAQQYGAQLIYPCELQGISTSKGRLVSVETSVGKIKADRLVLATGAEPAAAQQFAGIELPQRSTPGAIAISKPFPRVMNRIIVAPGVHMHQREDGRIVLGEQAGAPKTDAHAQRLLNRPNRFPSQEIATQHGNRMLDIAKQFVPKVVDAEIEDAYIGWRPLPIDGHPVIGSSPSRPDVYLAVMHSGVSLAPIVGQVATKELLSGESIDGLKHYRPSREFESVRRY